LGEGSAIEGGRKGGLVSLVEEKYSRNGKSGSKGVEVDEDAMGGKVEKEKFGYISKRILDR